VGEKVMTPEAERVFVNLRKLNEAYKVSEPKPLTKEQIRVQKRLTQSRDHRSMMGFMDGQMLAAIRHQDEILNSRRKRGEVVPEIPLYDHRYFLTVMPYLFK
jgi:hypothetical protein